jgi:hypothetical protein
MNRHFILKRYYPQLAVLKLGYLGPESLRYRPDRSLNSSHQRPQLRSHHTQVTRPNASQPLFARYSI